MERLIFFVLFIGTLQFPAATQDITSLKDTSIFKYTVEPAPNWSNLFYRKSGWFGADGLFSIPLTGVDKNNNEGNDSTLLLFGDTFVGEVIGDKPAEDHVMVNNSIAYISGNDPDPAKIHFYQKKMSDGKLTSLFVPKTS